MNKKIIGTLVPLALMAPVVACSSGPSQSGVTSGSSHQAQAQAAGTPQSGPAQSNLGPFTISPCKLIWGDGPGYASTKAEAQAVADANGFTGTIVPSASFTITLSATAVVKSFVVAYFDASGREIATGTATPTSGPTELIAGQRASFMDQEPLQQQGDVSSATSCRVIGSDTGNS